MGSARRVVVVVLLVFLCTDGHLAAVNGALATGEGAPHTTQAKWARVEKKAGIVRDAMSWVPPLKYVFNTFKDEPELVRNVTRLFADTQAMRLAKQVVGLQDEEVDSLLHPQVLLEVGWETTYCQSTAKRVLDMVVGVTSILAILFPLVFVRLMDTLMQLAVVGDEVLVNLDELPASLTRWDEWKDVQFEHAYHGGHHLKIQAFRDVVQQHLDNLGIRASKRDAWQIVTLLPQKALVNSEVVSILKAAFAKRLSDTPMVLSSDTNELWRQLEGKPSHTKERQIPLAVGVTFTVADLQRELEAMDPRPGVFVTNILKTQKEFSTPESKLSLSAASLLDQTAVVLQAITTDNWQIDTCDSVPDMRKDPLCEQAQLLVKTLLAPTTRNSRELLQAIRTVQHVSRFAANRIRKAFFEGDSSENVVGINDVLKFTKRGVDKTSEQEGVQQMRWLQHVASATLVLVLVLSLSASVLEWKEQDRQETRCSPEVFSPPMPRVDALTPATAFISWVDFEPCQAQNVDRLELDVTPATGLFLERLGVNSMRLTGLQAGVVYKVRLFPVWKPNVASAVIFSDSVDVQVAY